jgi:hypothetical protein
MALDILKEKGTPLDRQQFDWRDLARAPISKLDDDAFTRARVLLMIAVEGESVRFQHACARIDSALRPHLARIRRVEHFQQTLASLLLPPDQGPLETTIAWQQTAVEVTAHAALFEPDAYQAQAYRFGLLEDLDHLYRFSALLDRLEGKDANNILQNHTDIRPGRPTGMSHRAPLDDLREPYRGGTAEPITRLHAITACAVEEEVRAYCLAVGPQFSDPAARLLYAEIAAAKEQLATAYGCLQDPAETLLEKWLLREANEVYNYHSCLVQEENPRVRAIWERFVGYELGQLHHVLDLYRETAGGDPEALLPAYLPDPIRFEHHRHFIRDVLEREADLRASGVRFIPRDQESPASASALYRARLNAAGSPSADVAAGYRWTPGTELSRQSMAIAMDPDVALTGGRRVHGRKG